MIHGISLFARLGLSLLALTTAFGFGGRRLADTNPPNFLVILIDDIGREWLSCYGSETVETPRIDALATGGVRFEHCYATPLCTTSRSVFLTGRYQFRTGWIWHSDPAAYGGGYFDWTREITFARLLSNAGYRTAVAGKWQINNLYEQPEALEKHGFDESCVWPGGQREDSAKSKRYWDAYVVENGHGSQRKGSFGPDVYCDYLIDFMRRNRDSPMLAFYAMHLVHTPFVKTPMEPVEKEGSDQREMNTSQYAAMVRYADHLIGRIIEALDELGLRENTIVLLAGDNGSPSGVDGRAWELQIRGGKGTLTESGIDVPFIVNCPKLIPGGRISEELADFSDILPTLTDFAGALIPSDLSLDGRSLAPVLRENRERESRDWIFSQYAERRVVRNRQFKLYSDGSFFDVQNDFLEKNDLVNGLSTSAATARKELQKVLDSLPRDVQLPFEPRSQSYFRTKGAQQPQ